MTFPPGSPGAALFESVHAAEYHHVPAALRREASGVSQRRHAWASRLNAVRGGGEPV